MSVYAANSLTFALLAVALCVPASEAHAQLLQDVPFNAQGIDVEDRVGEFIPLNVIFKDERGNDVSLGKYFKQDKPVILTLNYSDCPGLCIAQLDMLVDTLRELNGAGIGEDFDIVTVSIDPTESPEKAGRTKSKYIGLLRETQAEQGWHFLTGKQSEISRLADAVGFRYTYDRANSRYNHAAVTYFISSEGRVCRSLLSLGVEPDQFKLAIAEAAEGRLTRSLADAVIQMCFLYDPDANRYTASARRMMAFGGAAFTMLLLGFTAPFWFARRGKAYAEAQTAGAAKVTDSPNGALQTHPDAYNDTQPSDTDPESIASTEAQK